MRPFLMGVFKRRLPIKRTKGKEMRRKILKFVLNVLRLNAWDERGVPYAKVKESRNSENRKRQPIPESAFGTGSFG